MKKPSLLKQVWMLGILFFVGVANADVSLRNGNFFMTFQDIQFPGGLEPTIKSTYNSLSDYSGMFGYGWVTPYETSLSVELDGSLVVREAGGGQENRFIPKNYGAANTEEGVQKLVEIARKNGMIAQAGQLASYQKKLKENADFRSAQTALFVSKGWVPKPTLKEGAQLTSTRFTYQYITRVKNGYIRVMEGGNIEKFNDAGKLVQIADKNKNFINFVYNPNGRIIRIEDNLNRKMNLSYNNFGLLEKVEGTSGKVARYKYSDDRLLISRVDQDGVENTFKYSNDSYKFIVEVGYPAEKDEKGKSMTMGISYYGKDKYFAVKSVKNKDNTVQTYDYQIDPKDSNHYTVKVALKSSSGSKISDSIYEYFSKKRPPGEDFTWKMIQNIDGDKTETIYDEKLGFPLKISSNGRETSFQYDIKGRLTQKKTVNETIDMTYHPTIGKVVKVVQRPKGGAATWSEFSWDEKSGNLVTAKNSDKKSVKILYDNIGRMKAMVDQSGRQLTFKYNDQSKPIEIADTKLGKIKFTYKNSGEVDKIDSSGGPTVAGEVLKALQNLTDITAAAGVSFSL